MLCGGDEIGRTQRGNNNAYCQDNELSWFDWRLDDRRRSLSEFTRRLIEIRRGQPALRRRKFFRGQPIGTSTTKDLTWFRPDGAEMTHAEWHDAQVGALGLRLA